MIKNLFHISFLIFITFLFGCVKEDDVFEESFIEDNKVTETSIITSCLNEKYILKNKSVMKLQEL